MLLPLVVGCGSNGEQHNRLVVFAAASLSGVFTQLGDEFEAGHEGVELAFSFEGSSTLVDQLAQGAHADVLASADEATMDRAVAEGVIAGDPQQFTTNVLTIIVPPGNPASITGLDDTLAGSKLVICAEEVPCGAATQKLADALGVTLEPVSEETKVTDVRAKVESGQADAGVVYVTDAKASGDKVQTIPIEGAEQARNVYIIGVTSSAGDADLTREFVDLVRGPHGQEVLEAAGFGA